jgi:hypothetical protein
MKAASSRLRPELLPAPEPDEVVTVLLEELEVRAIVEWLWGLRAIRTGTHAVVEVVPDVRACQVDRFSVGCLAGFNVK